MHGPEARATLPDHGLVAAGGDREQVTAAVLVYRALTWALPILLGVGCWLWWHQSQLRPRPPSRSEAGR